MFIYEEPGHEKTENDRYFQRSRINSHLATRLHARRRATKAAAANKVTFVAGQQRRLPSTSTAISLRLTPKPPTYRHRSDDAQQESGSDTDRSETLKMWATRNASTVSFCLLYGDTGNDQEQRSLQYFKQRTAYEWSGWTDFKFWDVLLLQASFFEPAIKHAAVALGAFHEMVNIPLGSTRRKLQQDFALSQGRMALANLNAGHARMSYCSLLTAYVAVATVMLCTADMKFARIQQLQFELFEHIHTHKSQVTPSDWAYINEFLNPIVTRQLSKSGYYIDIAHGLRTTPACYFQVQETITIPEIFCSIQQMRDVLETLLKWTAFTTKSKSLPPGELPFQASRYLELFLFAVEEYGLVNVLDERNHLRIALLKISAKLNFMMIRTIHVDPSDLMFFDRFVEVFSEFADVFEKVILFTEEDSCQGLSFGIDSGILGFVGNSARWCRDPTIRRKLIALLKRSGRREAMEGAIAYAQLDEYAMQLEEQGIDPPPLSCHDVPLQNRVQIQHTQFWFLKYMITRYQTYPFGPNDYHDVWMDHYGCGTILDDAAMMDSSTGIDPDLIIGVGYTKWLEVGNEGGYFTIKDPKFFFPLPRI